MDHQLFQNIDLLQSQLLNHFKNKGRNKAGTSIPWSWVARRLIRLCQHYPAGLTRTIILSELELQLDALDFDGIARKGELSISMLKETSSQSLDHIVAEMRIKQVRFLVHTCIGELVNIKSSQENDSVYEMYFHQKLSSYVKEDPSFFLSVKRTVRFTNIRVQDNYGRKSEAPRLLPTENLVPILTPQDLQFWPPPESRSLLPSTTPKMPPPRFVQTTSLMDLDVETGVIGGVHLWLKWVHVFPKERSVGTAIQHSLGMQHHDLHGQMCRIHCNDGTQAENITLFLFDQQMALMSLIKKGDWVVILQPQIIQYYYEAQSQFGIVLGPQTMMCCFPNVVNQESYISCTPTVDPQSGVVSTQITVAPDEEGIFDFGKYPERIQLNMLKPKMVNLTLFGFIAAISPNTPIVRQGKSSDRIAIRVIDSTGNCDITVWEDLAQQCLHYENGQCLLFENITTSEIVEGTEKFYVNASGITHSKVYNVSLLTCLLTTPYLKIVTPLICIADDGHFGSILPSFYCVQAVITGWVSGSDYSKKKSKEETGPIERINQYVRPYHTICNKFISLKANVNAIETLSSEFPCPLCNVILDGNTVDDRYSLFLTLDDGTETVSVSGTRAALTDIISISPNIFRRKLTDQEQLLTLNKLIGKEVECILTRYSDKGITKYRIEAAHERDSITNETISRIHSIQNFST